MPIEEEFVRNARLLGSLLTLPYRSSLQHYGAAIAAASNTTKPQPLARCSCSCTSLYRQYYDALLNINNNMFTLRCDSILQHHDPAVASIRLQERRMSAMDTAFYLQPSTWKP